MSWTFVHQPATSDGVTVSKVSGLQAASAADARVERTIDRFSPLTSTLPPELMAESVRRLGWLALMYAIGVFVARFGYRALLMLSDSAAVGFDGSDAFGAAMALLSLAIFLVARRRLLPTTRLLDLGDIKPANIFLCRLGPDDDFVKVLDFGLVKHAAAAATAMQLTQAGFAAGTPAFMAPEIALGDPEIDGRADLYSLGCVAYYLLTGQFVFAADTPLAAAVAHVNDQPAPPSARSPFQIPARLEAVILQCLAKDCAERPASAVDLAHRLSATVPEEAWTAAAAQVWWDRHRPNEPLGSVPGAAANRPGSDPERRRCWPRLDAQSAPQRIARALLPRGR